MNIQDDEPPSSKLLTFLIRIAVISVCVLFYLVAGKSAIKEIHPEYNQFMDTSFHQSDCEPFPRYQVLASISAYTPREEECDSTPFITASGERVRNGIVANNCLPFYSIVEIEGIRYVVLDRMNQKYDCEHYDIFIWDLEQAIEFGRQTLIVNVY